MTNSIHQSIARSTFCLPVLSNRSSLHKKINRTTLIQMQSLPRLLRSTVEHNHKYLALLAQHCRTSRSRNNNNLLARGISMGANSTKREISVASQPVSRLLPPIARPPRPEFERVYNFSGGPAAVSLNVMR